MAKPLSTPTFVQAFEGSSLDEAQPLVIKRVKVLGLESRWGRKFTPECLQDAVARGIYEGVPIYKDHPAIDYDDPNWRSKQLPPRSVDDVLGSVRNVTYVEGLGLFGDAIFTKDCELTRSVMLAARTNPMQYGFSHHALYDNVHFEGKTEVVGMIPHVHSLDLVTRPATNKGLFEGLPMANETKKMTTPRAVLSAICTVGIARKVVQGIEGDFMDTPMPATEEALSVDEQISAAFRAAGLAIFDADGMDDKAKLSKLKELFAAKTKLSGGGEAPKEGATEGEAPAVSDKKDDVDGADKDKKPSTESAPPVGIGALEAMRLLDKHKLPISTQAVESYAIMPADIAESCASREVASSKEVAELKKRLELLPGQKPPQSVARLGLEGGGDAANHNNRLKDKDFDKKPWLLFSGN